MNDDDLWRDDGARNGWTLPKPAAWPWRAPVIRWFRFLIGSIRVEQHYAGWEHVGRVRTGYDEWVLYAIRRGWA